MKLVSWNVNGIRACINKDFFKSLNELDADIICLQETKASEEQVDLSNLFDYYTYWNSAVKKGYSGTLIITKEKPIKVINDIGIDHHDEEGRVIMAEYENFYLVNVYTPNSQRGLVRLDYRMQWEDDFQDYLSELDKSKPVILCGDLNVAHQEIDIENPKSNERNAGFTIEERNKFTQLLKRGFIDSFRYLNPDVTKAYSWWSYMHKAREKNIGWRIDYFVISERLKENLIDAKIHSDIYGSDHCPVSIELKF